MVVAKCMDREYPKQEDLRLLVELKSMQQELVAINEEPGRPPTQGRVFASTQRDTEFTPDVVTGTLTIFGRDAHVLIDPRSTHSFVSQAFAVYTDTNWRPLECSMVVATPIGKSLISENVYKDSKVMVGDREMHVELIPLDI
ncbi:hypothetical protein LWI29_019135 [Acer saccharum]|uniref:Uncharacterized protein n=1 Tax=Acer saccharum TaxID=4024 RepID=A0AA39VG77_ACESA|nr:hypothetical protein LWI29_019135 [Acer saccharum]